MPRATTFEEFGDAVASAFPRLSKQLRQIAQYVLEHPDDLALGTVATVAESAGVQPSALIRFANTMEFGGFTEMQQLFRAHLLERSGSYRERIDAMRRTTRPDVSDAGVLHGFVSQGIAELGRLQDNVRAADLTTAAQEICKASRVYVLAQRRAFPVACYLSYALSQLDIRTQLLDGVGGMLRDTLRQIDERDLLLVTSFKHYSEEVVEAARSAHGRGIPVVAITDFALSPLKPHADVCFELGRGPDAAFRSLVSPLCLAQALVVSAGHRLVGRARPAERPAPRAVRSAARKAVAP
jgi:DNA-binding MurR/RpiR family transcriptional regulator